MTLMLAKTDLCAYALTMKILYSILSIRLSMMIAFFFILFLIVVFDVHQETLTAGQLALFSVNSFLFGYYFNPLLQSQKTRVADLNTTARQEAMTILDILTQSHLLSEDGRHTLKVKLRVYLESILHNRKVSADNIYYDELLRWTKEVKGEDESVLNTIYGRVSATQVNRDKMANLLASRVYSHEWLVAVVLFAITLYFALQTHFGNSMFFGIMLAILCTGLCTLMAIMVKFATLTHKEAKRMWTTLDQLKAEHFDDVTAHETTIEKRRLDSLPAA